MKVNTGNARSWSTWLSAIAIVIFIWTAVHLNSRHQEGNPSASKGFLTKKPSALDEEPLRIYVPTDEPKDTLFDIPGLHHVASSPPAQWPDANAAAAAAAAADAEAAASPESEHDRPLILYAYSETDFGRVNLAFFVKHGLHDAADFIFILNGETDVDTKVLPTAKPNIRIIKRENKCYDLGAHAEVLTQEQDDGQKLKDKYKKFILMNASIRGPFVPHWSKECWSDAYLGRVNEKAKLVGSTFNCNSGNNPHVQSMIWATDKVGLDIILEPEALGDECFEDLLAAIYAEQRVTPHLRSKGYEVDAMLAVYQSEKDYKYSECKEDPQGDFLYENGYYGFSIHPYETLFMKSHRGIQDSLLEKLTEWEDLSNYSSYDVCKK